MKELKDYIWYKEDMLDPKLCDRLVTKWDKDVKNQVESGLGSESNQDVNNHLRHGKEMNISRIVNGEKSASTPIWKKDHKLLVDRTAEVLRDYGQELNLDARLIPEKYGFEEFRMKRYDNNDTDEFGPHVDVIDYNSARRFIVCFYYLNDVEEGGETAFPHLDVDFKPKKGACLVFPPLWLYLHEGRKPISGPKYIIGTYLHYITAQDFQNGKDFKRDDYGTK